MFAVVKTASLCVLVVLFAVCESKHLRKTDVIRVTCVGDSITEGGGCSSSESYVDILRTNLGSGYEVVNAGRSSMTMLKKGLCNDYSPCSYWNTSQYQTALNSNPDIVTIMLGTNDAKTFNWEGIQQDTGDYYALDYVELINKFKNLPSHPDVYLMIPPPLFEPWPFDMNGTIINQIYPALGRNIADVAGVPIIDIYSAMNGVDLTCDRCHPTHDGRAVIAKAIEAALISRK